MGNRSMNNKARQALTGEAGGSNQSDQDVGNGAEGTV